MSVETVGDLWEGDGALQSLENIGLKILSILNTAGDADKVVVDTDGLTGALWDTGVGHGSWNLDQGLNTSEGLGKSEDVGGLAETLSSGSSSLDAERQHTTSHTVAVLLLGNGAVWVRLKAWVVDGNDVWGGLECLGNAGSVDGGLAGTEMEGLETTVSEPAVKGRWDSTNGVLEECKAGLHGLRVEGSDTHNDIGVAVDVLGDGVNDNVGTVIKRVLHVWGKESVVDDNHNAVLVSLLGDGANVNETESWVGWSLDPDELGILCDMLANVDLNLWSEGHVDAVCLSDLSEVSVGSAVDVGDGDNVGASSQRLEDNGGGGRAGGECKSILGVLESGDGLLEVVTVWVGAAGVLVLANWLANSALGEGGGEGDGLNDGTGDWVVRRASVDGESAEALNWRWSARWCLNWPVASWLCESSWARLDWESHVAGDVELMR